MDWAAVSVALAKERKNVSRIVVCMDEDTETFAWKIRHPLLDLVDQVVVTPEFNGTPRERSRWVKTSMRSLLDGDYIYIDSDALPISDFDELALQNKDFASVPDQQAISDIAHWYAPAANQLNWKIPPEIYLNSGVYFVADNDRTRNFAKLWREKWLEWRSFDKSGVSADQPAFNSAIIESNMTVQIMPEKFNVFLSRPNISVDDPRIFHYPASLRKIRYSSLLCKLSDQFRRNGYIDFKSVKSAEAKAYPWVLPLPLVWTEFLFAAGIGKIEQKMRRLVPVKLRSKLTR